MNTPLASVLGAAITLALPLVAAAQADLRRRPPPPPAR
jgi:hypothetical protein